MSPSVSHFADSTDSCCFDVPHYLCSPIPMFRGPMFPDTDSTVNIFPYLPTFGKSKEGHLVGKATSEDRIRESRAN